MLRQHLIKYVVVQIMHKEQRSHISKYQMDGKHIKKIWIYHYMRMVVMMHMEIT